MSIDKGTENDTESLIWVGKTEFKLRDMQLNERRDIKFTALVTTYGIFDLNHISFKIKPNCDSPELEKKLRDELIVRVSPPSDQGSDHE